MEDKASVQGEALRDSYVQGETIHYSFVPANPTSGEGNLTVLRVDPGEEPTLVYHAAIAWDPGTRRFTIRLNTAALVTGYYEFIIWVNGEMEPRRVEIIAP